MARIPDSDLDRLKREIPIERLVKAAGIELRKRGANLVGRCPFHEDHDPSLVLTPEKNLWHCLGACNTGGSVIDWIIKTRGVTSAMPLSCSKPTIRLVRAGRKDCPQRLYHQARATGRRRRGSPRDPRSGGRLLSRDAEAEPRSIALSRKPRPRRIRK